MAQLIVFLPLLGFLFCFFFGKIFGVKTSQIITTSFLFISAILSWFLFFSYLGEGEMEVIYIFNWFTSGNFIVDWSIRLDSLTTTMFIVVAKYPLLGRKQHISGLIYGVMILLWLIGLRTSEAFPYLSEYIEYELSPNWSNTLN